MSEQNFPTASLTHRLMALAYDSLVLVSLYIVVGFVLVGVATVMNNGEAPGEFPASVNFSLMFIICFLYYTTSWQRGGQTIGMKAWRIKLINNAPSTNGPTKKQPQYKPIQLSQCMLRTSIGFFSLVAFGLGFFWMLVDKQQRSWHDMASLTRVVHIPNA